ncbi:MAG: glycerol-3-phosphate 1-O-acyltransferase PlsY [Deltaproteobacteria bacterium]|nr:glycerol-3-phosphate 1-O-acyltransferase PlsY [Deltaproteobacteria bacterium]
MDSVNLFHLFLIPFAYLLGSVPTGVVAARLTGGVDPRSAGSRNIGATNVGRTSGRTAGVLTLAGDMLKGAAPAVIAAYLSGNEAIVAMAGLFAFLGHLFPVFLGFKGGKGVATACGVFLVISPATLFLSAGVFILMLLITRYVSVGSMAAALSLPVFMAVFKAGSVYIALGAVVALLIVIKHSDNIKRLIEGRENRFRAS